MQTLRHLRQHQSCGGGLVQSKAPGDGRPLFTCTKCGGSFTSGLTGEPWASAVPLTQPNTERKGGE